ncbi:hypothetical protein ACWDXT_34760, partial [Streptomyces sp. NPDC003236]
EARNAQEAFRGKALKAPVNNATIPQSRPTRKDSVAMHDRKRLSASAAFDALGAEYERAFAESAAHHASLQRLLARPVRGITLRRFQRRDDNLRNLVEENRGWPARPQFVGQTGLHP